MRWALNHMTTPGLSYGEFLDLAARLGCVGVEARNDLGRPLFDGRAPEQAGAMARDRGLRLVGLSQVYPFNVWGPELAEATRGLIDTAKAAGAETISLIPLNDGTGTEAGARQVALDRALAGALPLLEGADMVALVEPLGFAQSSLRDKAELVAAIDRLGAGHRFRLVHDTFHHALAGGGAYYPARTGIVHISGVTDPAVPVAAMEDAHRVPVDADDRLGSVDQLRALRAQGYDGVVSVECFAPETQALADPYSALRASFDHIAAALGRGGGRS